MDFCWFKISKFILTVLVISFMHAQAQVVPYPKILYRAYTTHFLGSWIWTRESLAKTLVLTSILSQNIINLHTIC